MLATVKEMLDEAEFRLTMLGVPQDQAWLFRAGRELMVCLPPIGGRYPADHELKQLAQECGQEYDALIYLAIRSYEPNKEDAFLYVDRDKDRWETARDFLKMDTPRAIVHNYSTNDEYIATIRVSCSKYGIIRIS